MYNVRCYAPLNDFFSKMWTSIFIHVYHNIWYAWNNKTSAERKKPVACCCNVRWIQVIQLLLWISWLCYTALNDYISTKNISYLAKQTANFSLRAMITDINFILVKVRKFKLWLKYERNIFFLNFNLKT